MAYVTYDEMILRYPVVKSNNMGTEAVNSDLIYYGEVEVNGRLGTNYTVPFSPPPPIVKDLAMDVAYHKFLRKKDPEEAAKLWKGILDTFIALNGGNDEVPAMALVSGSGTVIQPNNADSEFWSDANSYHPTFSDLDAESPYSHVDSARVYNQEVERGRDTRG
jgi:hypothetical protein